ncbi:hypothetical protein [Mitsuokella sp. WILCCON 0060]|uniref:hypothetical protein n=1 Tax=Mitsuokella sp. WILCCON 0060 TaxID=3345341 RepID=UPI003F1A4892
MSTTVNASFADFMKNHVNLDSEDTKNARNSKDNLLNNIKSFNDDEEFFHLCEDFNIQFGSFARRTKIRPLDDIDLMIGLSADGGTYTEYSWDDIRINVSSTVRGQKDCRREDGTLNSTQVLNKFRAKLKSLANYSRSDIKRSQEAIVLNLKSQDWSYDIVPCYHTVKDINNRSYYLIPNGNGNWKKTDPSRDRDYVTRINQSKEGRLLELIRLSKKWNTVKNAPTMPSYLLETMVVRYAESEIKLSEYIDWRFKYFLKYLYEKIYSSVDDLKEIQGDINTLTYEEKSAIYDVAKRDYDKAVEAGEYETQRDMEKSINKWREIMGSDFPTYG